MSAVNYSEAEYGQISRIELILTGPTRLNKYFPNISTIKRRNQYEFLYNILLYLNPIHCNLVGWSQILNVNLKSSRGTEMKCISDKVQVSVMIVRKHLIRINKIEQINIEVFLFVTLQK